MERRLLLLMSSVTAQAVLCAVPSSLNSLPILENGFSSTSLAKVIQAHNTARAIARIGPRRGQLFTRALAPVRKPLSLSLRVDLGGRLSVSIVAVLMTGLLAHAQNPSSEGLPKTQPAVAHSPAPSILPTRNFYARDYPGADIGAQINAADRAAGPARADITVNTSGSVTTIPTVSSKHRLILAAPLTWRVALVLSDNTQVLGAGDNAVQTVSTNDAWITGSLSDVTIENLRVKNLYPSATANSTVLHCLTCNGISMTNNRVLGMGLIHTGSTTGEDYARITASSIGRDIHLANNYVDGLGNIVVLAYLEFVNHVVSSNNTAVHAQYNIEWWGGNAAVEGRNAANPRWASDITVTGGSAKDVVAGFWGSMGQDVTVSGVTVENCQDVGVDGESSTRVRFTNFTVHNCKNGGVAVFFASRDNDFGPGTVISDMSSSKMFFGHNVSADPNAATGVTVHNVEFVCKDPAELCVLLIDPIGSFVFTQNKIQNAIVEFTGTNNSGFEISRNTFLYSFAPAKRFSAINIPGQVANFRKSSNITGNNFQSESTQLLGTFAINASITDYNYPAVLEVRDNTTKGFANDAKFTANSGNAGISPTFIIKGNSWGANSVAEITLGALGTFRKR